MATPDTKDRILDAAEELFAAQGFDGTSLRAVTRAAEVNLAAVNYHFGHKLGLFQAVFERRVAPINAERLARLDQLEAQGSAPHLEELLEVLLLPALRLAKGADPGFARFLQILGRSNSVTGEHAQTIRRVFAEVQRRFFPLLQAALPGIPPEVLFWRLHFVIGALCTQLSDPGRLAIVSGGLCSSADPDVVAQQLVAFAVGGLRAPVPASTSRTGGRS